MAEEHLENAVVTAQLQYDLGVRPGLEVLNPIFEPLEEPLRLDELGDVQGKARGTWPGGEVYEGDLEKGKPHGQGIFHLSDGVYEGGFKDGLYHGQGTYKYADGDVYEGEYLRGWHHGYGSHKFASGNAYEGEYQHNHKHGRGIYKHSCGDVDAVFYENGKAKDGVRLGADRQRAWLLLDGKEKGELSISEARQKAQDMGLPELPP